MNRYLHLFFFTSFLFSQVEYNHPEIDWKTIETDHFSVHFYDGTEQSAREGAYIAEQIYPFVTELYDYEPPSKTHIVFLDTDDFSNGMAYYYDNKIYIWTSPLDFELRGSHRWLQNVITHEFTHIISIQVAMKYGKNIPGGYLQWMGYEKEKRKDVLYGYPNTLASFPIPGTIIPPWLAEGTAQYMYDEATWDLWDSHRDMILRDRYLNNNLLSFTEMNTFGKKGIGNESTYNSGYALCNYIAKQYGSDALKNIMNELSSPINFSVNKAIQNSIGINSNQLYDQFIIDLGKKYTPVEQFIGPNKLEGEVLISEGTANLHPVWSPDGNQFAFISNQENDYFSQTDLFIYTIDSKEQNKITSSIKSAVTWGISGKYLYYSKKPKYPDKNGSKYFDLFEYDVVNEEEKRLTFGTRAFSPVYIEKDSSIAFISTLDGIQNISTFDLKTDEIKQITNYKDHRILHSVSISSDNSTILVDYTLNHFRNISSISLTNNGEITELANQEWDERDPVAISETELLYVDDQNGIFNLSYLNIDSGESAYCTNVMGGAFMPDINKNGQVVYSLYKDGKYTIAFLDSIQLFPIEIVGYPQNSDIKHLNVAPYIDKKDFSEAKMYNDAFPPMFIMPKLMVDYGTLKPGFFFYSSEVLQRLSLFGGASVNSLGDLDLFFLFEFKRLYPTLFTEVYYLTRNKTDKFDWRGVYPIDDNLKFRMIAFKGGLKLPILGISSIELYSMWQRYRAHIKQNIPTENLQGGLAYDYYRGVVTGLKWKMQASKHRFDSNINPSNGFSLEADIAYENNEFITGLDLSDAGTLIEAFSDNDYLRMDLSGSYHWEVPGTNRWTITLDTDLGLINFTKVDSFFNYFAGGLDGIQGYSYYSIEGTNKVITELDFRIPIFYQKHYQLGWFIAQNSVIGLIGQFGDAWTTSNPDWKKSVGIQWRLNGFSFYNYPTAIGLEAHYGIDKFEKLSYSYGQNIRWYFTMLFGF